MKSNGPGKYDWLATKAREEVQAGLLVLMVADGSLGSGFAVQAIDPEYLRRLPEMLEQMAAEIRKGML